MVARRRDPVVARARRRRGLWLGALLLLALLAAGVFFLQRMRGDGSVPAFPEAPAQAAAPPFEDFAGAQACAECHADEYRTWRASTHGRAGGDPAVVELLRPFDGKAIRFRDAEVTPRREAGRFVFVIERPGRVAELLTVDGVVGGGHMVGGGTQGFVTPTADGTLRLIPFEVAAVDGVWFCNTNTRLDRGWLPITPNLRLADCGDWPPQRLLGEQSRFATCQQCHGSQIDVAGEAGRPYATRLQSLAIDCESCHGPGRPHIAAVRNEATDLRMTSLATLDEAASNRVCFACHALKDVLRPDYRAGADLESFYSLLLPLLSGAPVYADGRIRTFAYQQGHLWSDCYVAGTMTCTDCHAPHSQNYRDVNGAPLVGRYDDGQCTACHASKAVEPERHTRHAPGSDGARCVSCHMPFLQEPEVGPAIRYARSDHTIPVPRPAADSALGVEVACGLCHSDVTTTTLEDQVRAGWGTLKPRRPIIERLLRAGDAPGRETLLDLLDADTGEHEAATFLVVGTLLRDHLRPDGGLSASVRSRLETLARFEQPDIAAAALASLHFAAGKERRVRRFLVQRLDSLGERHTQVRDRWAVLLGFLGDRASEDGRIDDALAAYAKALEVAPEDASVLANVGLAHAAANDFAAAVSAYRRSVAADPGRALTHVNLGIALAAFGDAVGAERAYRDALAIDEREALAWFNLGNLQLRDGRAGEAEASYQEAVRSDRGLAPAWFNLSRARVALDNLSGAAAAIRAGLDFDPGNDKERAFLDELLRAGVTPDSVPVAPRQR